MAENYGIQVKIATVLLIIALSAIAPNALASMLKLSVEDLTREADVIVIGEVKDAESRWDFWRTMIYTYTTLSVDKYIKGAGGNMLTVITMGGEAGGSGIWVEDMPELIKGEKVLIFLKRSGNDFTVAGLIQGKYNIEQGEVKDISGNETNLDNFIRQIEAVKPSPDATTPEKTVAAPGFETMLGFLGFLAVRNVLRR